MKKKKRRLNKSDCINDAKNYLTPTDWKKNSESKYKAAKKNGWFDECIQHMKVIDRFSFWTKEKCIEEAKKYSTKREWHSCSYQSYNISLVNEWMDECTRHMKTRYFRTKKSCQEDAIKYKTRTEYSKQNNASYSFARRKGWLDEICSHMIKKK